MSPASDRIAIGIISFERGRLTQRCIDSIRRTSKTPYHIYIIDNGSCSETTRSYLDQWGQQRDITLDRLGRNYGPSTARNRIIEIAGDRHEIFAMLDNDIIALEGWDVAARACLRDGFDVTQPKLLNSDCATVSRGPTRPWPGNWMVHPEYIGSGATRYSPEVSRRQNVELFAGTAVIHARVFDGAGSYDPRLWNAEDYDLAYRAANRGLRACYEPRCELVHHHEFDVEYDQQRCNPEKALISHAIMWQKHHRLLLPHFQIKLFLYLLKRQAPMFIPHKARTDALLARAQRRIVHEYFWRRYGDVWPSRELGETVTMDLIDRLGYERLLGNLPADCKKL
jgi:GT2 family glycosyltransferase